MQPLYDLGRTRQAEALREAQQRHRSITRTTCRRRVLGLPIGPACEPRLSTSPC